MRVVHVCSYFAPAFVYGGPPRSILGLCQALIGAGVDVEVLTTTANGPTELEERSAEGVRYEGVPVRYFPLGFPRRFFGVRGLGPALDAELERCDLVHVHGIWNVPAWIAMDRSREAGIPYVVSPRGMLDRGSMRHHRVRKMVFYRLREKARLRGAAFLHATSSAERDALVALSLGPEVVTLPNGVSAPDAPAPPDFRARHRLPPGRPLVVYLGRLHPTKRLDLLVASFAEARRVLGDLELVLAGRADGVAPSTLVGDGIHLLGQLSESDKWALLGEASVLVMCSDSESFGLSVVEAMAKGVPVVVTKTCPWPVVEERRLGFWVEQSPAQIGSAIVRIAADRAEARAMGARGRALVEQQFQWRSIGREMATRYERAVVERQ